MAFLESVSPDFEKAESAHCFPSSDRLEYPDFDYSLSQTEDCSAEVVKESVYSLRDIVERIAEIQDYFYSVQRIASGVANPCYQKVFSFIQSPFYLITKNKTPP